ncbi:MAG: hypothetical protein AB4042_05285 [Leptolyngbyaceae cyanobacterium]
MLNLKQIQQDIQDLPDEAQILVVDFIEILKKRYPKLERTEDSTYQKFKTSGFIGCVSIEENLSTTYKQVLAKNWKAKYDHR